MKSLNFNKRNLQNGDVLSKTQMKRILGGDDGGYGGGCPDGGLTQGNDYVYCKDGTRIASTNKCSNSSGVCNGHGGFDYCVCL